MLSEKMCVVCSAIFSAKRKDVKYCSDKCKRKAEHNRKPLLKKTCLHCGGEFEAKRAATNYCSASCSNIACKKHDDVKLNCKKCGKEFTRKYIHRDKLFCSRSCATTNQNNIMYADDNVKNKISKSLKDGYATGEIKPSFLGKTHNESTKKILSELRIEEGRWRGENNPAYGGQSKEVREKMSKTRAERIQNGTIHARLIGEIQTIKAGLIKYRSNWEKMFIENLDKDNSVLTFIFEPVVIEYFYDQKRNYIPDLLIIYNDNIKKLVEVKPSYFLDADINKCKFAAAEEYCKDKGMIFEVWTEKDNPYLV